jgi:multimeric flavodoxin WrbA
MKIFAVSGSPRKDKGNTDRILKPFLEGAKEAGAEVELVYVHGMNIKPCNGCNACWLKTPGRCIQKDDMTPMLDKVRESEVIVVASPIYVGGVTGQTKTFLDRMTPVSLPFIEMIDGYATHTKPENSKLKGLVFVSNNGFHELYHFDDLVNHCKSIAKMLQSDFLGALLRPHGVVLEMAEKHMPDKVNAVYDAARQAGRELVEKGIISKELEDEVAKELVPIESFIEVMNKYFHDAWDAAIEKEKNKKS